MFEVSQYTFLAAMVALAAGLVLYLVSVFGPRGVRALSFNTGGTQETDSFASALKTAGRYGTILSVNAFGFLTASIIARWIAAGHGPFSNMYEFSLAFAWGAMGIYLYFERQYDLRSLGLLVLPIALGMLIYASTVPDDIQPLVPALQQSLLLSVHVAVAVGAYGAFAVGFGAAVLFLIQRKKSMSWLPERTTLDEVGYRSVMIGFPLMALTIILGAIWADIAWGRYWSWDPKETASLVTWLMYGGYLHARVIRGWRGDRSAYLLLLGFAATAFTYYGNYFLGGLHSYG
ncbi:MAG: c-type cytochrome biogenesis protein CcsB [Dehalococcoidia bacterium]|nr:c-type cytochrome biogenesis protein CcsB [Dehalococcoidia bacterium]